MHKEPTAAHRTPFSILFFSIELVFFLEFSMAACFLCFSIDRMIVASSGNSLKT